MALLSAIVRDAAAATLKAAVTIAGPYVYTSRDQPQADGYQPTVSIHVISEHGEAKAGQGAPHFLMTLTLAIECLVRAPTLAGAEQALDVLREQVVDGLLTAPAFASMTDERGRRRFEGFSDLVVRLAFNAEGDRHVGSAKIGLGIRYHDVYQPRLRQALTTVGVGTDAGNVFDPSGAYDPARPAPRTSGPDGRIEIGGMIALPQPTPDAPGDR